MQSALAEEDDPSYLGLSISNAVRSEYLGFTINTNDKIVLEINPSNETGETELRAWYETMYENL